jgi:hypothetical protein
MKRAENRRRWEQRLAAWQKSGLRLGDYCRREGLRALDGALAQASAARSARGRRTGPADREDFDRGSRENRLELRPGELHWQVLDATQSRVLRGGGTPTTTMRIGSVPLLSS